MNKFFLKIHEITQSTKDTQTWKRVQSKIAFWNRDKSSGLEASDMVSTTGPEQIQILTPLG